MSTPNTTLDTPAGSLTAELGALVDEFMSGITERTGRLAECGTNGELIEAVQSIERALRAAEQATSSVVSAVETRGLFSVDGHRDARGWLRAGAHMLPDEVTRRHRLGRFGRMFPQAAEALAAGEIAVGHVNKLAKVWSNPRIRHEVATMVDVWLLIGSTHPYAEFCAKIDNWAREIDVDGGHRDRDESHRSRDARFLGVGDTTLLRGQFCGVQAEILQQIFQGFVDCEYRYDVDEAKARHGVDHVTEQQLARTPAQRRADAMYKLFEAAAGAPLDGAPIKITVDIVVDQETFEEQLLAIVDPLHDRRHHATVPWPTDDPHGAAGPSLDKHLASVRLDLTADDDTGADAGESDGAAAVGDGSGEAESWIAAAVAAAERDAAQTARVASRCHTRRGATVTPTDAVYAALIGHVRRVVMGAAGVIIDLGEKKALYSGSSREAAMLQSSLDGHTRCIWPGCTGAPRHVDHTIPRCEGGPTAPYNSGLMCARHNIFKSTGYRTRRDALGRFHIYRADGSEVAAI